jgi:hypothetical protein
VRRFYVGEHDVELDKESVEAAVDGLEPEPIRTHHVDVDGRRYPPEQVLAQVTGIDRSEIDPYHAEWVMFQLGFIGDATREAMRLGPYNGRQAAMLAPHRGQWVALAGPLDLLVAADTPHEVFAWLRAHERRADYGIFRVPEHDWQAEGAGPW